MHQCSYCDKQFDRPSLLKRHTLTHTGERPFECRFCGKGFSTRSGVNTHERTHTGHRPYVCRICGRRFAAGSNLIFHKYTHTNVSPVLWANQLVFSTPYFKTRRHQCTQCPKAFVTPGDLRKHEYTHTGEWPFRCAVCNRGFATERNLKTHEIIHTGMTFLSCIAEVTALMRSLYASFLFTGQKPFTCTICAKSYTQESSLKTHMRNHQRKQKRLCSRATNVKHLQKNPNRWVFILEDFAGAMSQGAPQNMGSSPPSREGSQVAQQSLTQRQPIRLDQMPPFSSLAFMEHYRQLYQAYMRGVLRELPTSSRSAFTDLRRPENTHSPLVPSISGLTLEQATPEQFPPEQTCVLDLSKKDRR
ncbi:unnamed protein product [Mesocestoides corti]|uniref:C2H2-type domain-containing protein n=1 Tax=Mesocestoides corti TaxID=53468 RepID=A0A0R3U213_MESCO|nr:unnamed protein product [Mesocestoides corti]